MESGTRATTVNAAALERQRLRQDATHTVLFPLSGKGARPALALLVLRIPRAHPLAR